MTGRQGTSRTMANDDAKACAETMSWPQVKSGPIVTGGILVGIGALVAFAGVAVAGTHVVAATRAWIEELETPPAELARLKWEQAKTAASAGAATWRDHPNARVRPLRRAAAS